MLFSSVIFPLTRRGSPVLNCCLRRQCPRHAQLLFPQISPKNGQIFDYISLKTLIQGRMKGVALAQDPKNSIEMARSRPASCSRGLNMLKLRSECSQSPDGCWET